MPSVTRMILDLFEYSEETDNETGAVHDETNHDETDQRELAVAKSVTDLSHAWQSQWRSGQLTVPSNAASRGAGYRRGEVVVKAKR